MTIQCKSEIVNARFEGDELDRIMEFCFQNDLTKSELVRISINLFMKYYHHREKIKTLISWLNDNSDKHESL